MSDVVEHTDVVCPPKRTLAEQAGKGRVLPPVNFFRLSEARLRNSLADKHSTACKARCSRGGYTTTFNKEPDFRLDDGRAQRHLRRAGRHGRAYHNRRELRLRGAKRHHRRYARRRVLRRLPRAEPYGVASYAGGDEAPARNGKEAQADGKETRKIREGMICITC